MLLLDPNKQFGKNIPVFIEALMNPKAYPHYVKNVILMETHISWIILTGKYAYKIKKDLDFGFFNGTNIKERMRFCKEEIRLNRRLSPHLYIGISAILGPPKFARLVDLEDGLLDNKNPQKIIHILDYAVKMIEFPQSELIINYIKENLIPIYSIKRLAFKLAKFHLNVEVASRSSNYGNKHQVIKSVQENLKILKSLNLPKNEAIILEEHQQWVNQSYKKLEGKFNKRLVEGAIRECHGDLHLNNIRINKKSELDVFDAIDFNENLRWIDPISEISFLMMDLSCYELKKESILFLNTWLEETGDYSGLELIKWYSAYRAMVRAKVAGLRWEQLTKSNIISKASATKTKCEFLSIKKYLSQAKSIHYKQASALIIMFGLSGNGKSYLSELLCEELFAVRIRSDVERKRLFKSRDFHIQKNSNDILIQKLLNNSKHLELYSKIVTDHLFRDRIPDLAKNSLNGGITTIIDAAFLKYKERRIMFSISKTMKVPYIIIECKCSDSIAKTRIKDRLKKGLDPSEATLEIREKQKSYIEYLNAKEAKHVVVYDQKTPLKDLVKSINSLIKKQKQLINRVDFTL